MQIGARLKEAREAQNLSLEELQEITKIQKRYLLAIEEGNLQILPGKFYARAFMKEYANAVGLDPNELMEEYKEEVPKTEEPTEEQYSRIQRSRKSQEKSTSNFSLFPTVIVGLLIIGIIAVAIFFIAQNMSGTESKDPVNQDDGKGNDIVIKDDSDGGEANQNTADEDQDNEEQDGNDEDTEETNEKAKEPEFTVIEEGTGNTPESTVAFSYTGDEVKATLEASDDTWLGVKADEEDVLFEENMFNAEQSPLELDLTGKERVFFKIGNASVLTITINGKEMEYPVDPSNVRQNIWVELKQEAE
ncbi:helix-turn-helix domain-containing protein [Virgibacillus dokdonensis]|uniref:Cytoskeletal protein RodZ n=2 Tax=Virgibacillus TaxID=84406 RepID=A0A2K9J5Z7_9BACI|nr:helix-turn-helix domain-containing protein [Virgibacillus dokdonensis]AUJ26613.1 cytoskeletal protein RodZ [Virgibacillus dokdonensis]NWO15139.1 helix-turn-helix domain-containing protein [Virgibacillus sp.]